jgi:hypothetical protein
MELLQEWFLPGVLQSMNPPGETGYVNTNIDVFANGTERMGVESDRFDGFESTFQIFERCFRSFRVPLFHVDAPGSNPAGHLHFVLSADNVNVNVEQI